MARNEEAFKVVEERPPSSTSRIWRTEVTSSRLSICRFEESRSNPFTRNSVCDVTINQGRTTVKGHQRTQGQAEKTAGVLETRPREKLEKNPFEFWRHLAQANWRIWRHITRFANCRLSDHQTFQKNWQETRLNCSRLSDSRPIRNEAEKIPSPRANQSAALTSSIQRLANQNPLA